MAAVDVDFVRGLVEGALQRARAESAKSDNSERSRAFVKALHEALSDHYEADHDVIVMSRSCESNRERMGMNELLHDVLVCRIAPVRSAKRDKELWYVTEALWQIESELAHNSAAALIDFNKLVLGAARYKLFVGPLVHDPEAFIDVLRPAAARCTGDVFAVLIPHPDRWDEGEVEFHAWRFDG
ncbi:MAG: hypothetical protein KC486_06285 [Myxococcales bacterium]|nr:hypothetical protein [Myxococcales bacterium]